MHALAIGSGLTPRFASPPLGDEEAVDFFTEEAGLRAPAGQTLRVTPLVEEGALVAEGAAVACLRDAPELCFAAPMPSRVARISLLPGRRLSEIVLFREDAGDSVTHARDGAGSEAGLRTLMQRAGLWPSIGRRPFGGMPDPAERPAAIVVMALDTRPFAPDPRRALAGRERAFGRGLDGLATLTDGTVFVCKRPGPQLVERGLGGGRVRTVDCGPRHPHGSPGIRIHDLAPASIAAPVWDMHAEDVAALGDLMATGRLPMRRIVSIAGAGLRESATVCTQPGADLRGLTRRIVNPGPHVLLSGSPLEGLESHWLGARDRQVTVLPREGRHKPPHWLVSALTRTARAKPAIPSAALDHAFGAALPAAPFIRALGSGDEETAMRLGVLSLLEEDIALADYALGGADLMGLLRGMLDRIRTEFAA